MIPPSYSSVWETIFSLIYVAIDSLLPMPPCISLSLSPSFSLSLSLSLGYMETLTSVFVSVHKELDELDNFQESNVLGGIFFLPRIS